ncbi:unnamed protein product, partial [Phaeothamnion confervicola]
MEKIGSACIVHLSPEKVWMCAQASYQDDMAVYAELKKDLLFEEYRIASQADNCIMFEINATILLRALTSVKNAPMCQIKLTKRQGQPCLSIETRVSDMFCNRRGRRFTVLWVLPAQEHAQYQAPAVPPPQVQLELPRGRSVRTVVDRMKSIDKYLHIDATMGGQLVLRVEKNTGEATIKTFYNGLVPR